MSYPPEKTPVAQDIFTMCTREKTETWHVVKSHNAAGIVERVICKSCGADHKYRYKKESTGAAAIRRRVARPKSSDAPSSEALKDIWFERIKNWGEKSPIDYSPSHVFEEGDVLLHKNFGKGAVQKLRGNRMDVLFEGGLKVLPSKQKVLEF